ncbi:MAG: transposase [Candidatus Marinimicrobia bacterium]|nr:transposase [Candidatus Neomarinimicrobiota bacterium]
MRCLYDDFKSGSIFHVYNHAIDDLSLFYDDQDCEFFLVAFTKQLEKIPASIFAYCLMPNHYHFLIRQDEDEKIFRIFNYAFISYAKYFNRKYERKGHIFRSPLQHKEVNDRTYLIQLCKYIHLNPVYADLVEEPEDWFYSNYREWIGQRNGKLFAKEIYQNLFPGPQDYITYVNSFQNYIKDKTFRNLKIDLDLLV